MPRPVRQGARLVVAAVVAATAYVGLSLSPATAAACPTADGVTVIVDFHELSGGVQTVCRPDGGGDRASQLFPAAGFSLDYVQRQPGFVCRVAGKPADDPCVSTPPADAYWGLWWSDGTSGRWTYATTAAGGLTVPDGGYVAFSWNGSGGSAPPGASPAVHADPTPTQEPTKPGTHPGSHPGAGAGQQSTAQPSTAPSDSPSGSPDGSPSGTAAGKHASAKPGTKPKHSRSGSSTPSPSPSERSSPSETGDDVVPASSSEPPDAGDGGLPTWVAPLAVLALFGAAGGAALVRRRRAGAA